MAGTVTRLSTVPFNEPGENPVNVAGYIAARALAGGVAESITIPSGGVYVRIAATDNIFYLVSSSGGSATVPADTDDGTACELLKVNGKAEWRLVPAGATTLSVISSGTPIVTASFYGV